MAINVTAEVRIGRSRDEVAAYVVNPENDAVWIGGVRSARMPPEVFEAIKDWHEGYWSPMGRLGTPADIGNVVALFCSEDAGWITGQTIVADGGSSLMEPVFPPAVQRG